MLIRGEGQKKGLLSFWEKGTYLPLLLIVREQRGIFCSILLTVWFFLTSAREHAGSLKTRGARSRSHVFLRLLFIARTINARVISFRHFFFTLLPRVMRQRMRYVRL